MAIKDKNPDATSDLTGETCPYTVMGLMRALKSLGRGQILEVITDYAPAARESIPNFLKKKDYPFTVAEVDAGKWRIVIEKAD